MKPWEKLGMSRATWHRKGKPTEVAPKRTSVYTADGGLHRARKVGTAEETKTGTSEFVVERRAGRPRKDAPAVVKPEAEDEAVREDWPKGLGFDIDDDSWEDEQAERGHEWPDVYEP